EDFQYALSIVGPAQVGFESKKPSARWEHVGGYDKLKTRVRQLATWPLQRPEAYVKLGVKPPAGLLLYGPSGCGKTLLVHALAASCPMNYISVKGSEIYSKYLGESESMVRKLFAAARRLAPCLLFMDELDAIGTRREWSDEGGTGVNERVLSTLLNEMDGVQERKGVFIIACTTRPEKIDDALLRPGRLDHHLYIPLPTVSDRRGILESLRGPQGAEILGQDVDIGRLAELTEGYSGADLSVLVRYVCIL
ncbi:P-loop containing nucleoside triphosphate hydrolase protein, partial [Powellomyces hirtus]